MATVAEIIRGINAYPIPTYAIGGFALNREVELDNEATTEIVKSAAFQLLKADVLTWLAYAPNISQGGQSYSLSEEQRKEFLAMAKAIYAENDVETHKVKYGYKGTRI